MPRRDQPGMPLVSFRPNPVTSFIQGKLAEITWLYPAATGLRDSKMAAPSTY